MSPGEDTAARPASSYALSTRDRRELGTLIEAEAQRVLAALVAARPAGPICVLALIHGSGGEEELVVEDAAALTEPGRAALRSERPAALAYPGDWDLADLLDPDDGADDDPSDDLFDALDEAGCEDPAEAFALDVAARVAERPLPFAVTDDFECQVVAFGEPLDV